MRVLVQEWNAMLLEVQKLAKENINSVVKAAAINDIKADMEERALEVESSFLMQEKGVKKYAHQQKN